MDQSCLSSMMWKDAKPYKGVHIGKAGAGLRKSGRSLPPVAM
jgi:hypothetical protein